MGKLIPTVTSPLSSAWISQCVLPYNWMLSPRTTVVNFKVTSWVCYLRQVNQMLQYCLLQYCHIMGIFVPMSGPQSCVETSMFISGFVIHDCLFCVYTVLLNWNFIIPSPAVPPSGILG